MTDQADTDAFGARSTVRRWTGSELGRTLILIGSLLATAIPAFAVAYALNGWLACAATAAALVTCLAGGLLSMLLVQLVRDPQQVVPRVLLGMFPRTGIPLLVCMAAYLRGGPLVEVGFVYYIMAFYFVTLTVETVLLAGSCEPNHTTESQTG